MQTNIEKIKASKTLVKNLFINEITKTENEVSKINESLFAKSLRIADYVKKANEYFVSKECKEEMQKLNIDTKKFNFTKYVESLVNTDERQAQRYIQLGKVDTETLKEFKESGKLQSMKHALKFASDKKKGIVNLSATKPIIDKSKTIKPKKFEAKNKGIEILLHEVIESEKRIKDIEESIKYLKSLLPIKEKKSKKAVSIVA